MKPKRAASTGLRNDRLNAYRIMWLFVFFDLPTHTKKDRRVASKFRKNLLVDGFSMMQYSVYARHCASSESADAHTRRIKSRLPLYGHINLLRITDKQYGNMDNYLGCRRVKLPGSPSQLELF
jgi:CRISPR-associated protein Cas2|tara:strand:+ start:4486 stop:4854 length:369 start_codon:yes stop_codon:yes gene_type:complete